MKRIVIILVAVLLLAGIAVAGLYFGGFILQPPADAQAGQEKAPPPPATLPAIPESAYYELKNVMLPAVRDGRFRNYINFDFKVEVKDEATAQQLKERNAHMRAALVSDFSTTPIETRDGPADFDDASVRARVLSALRRAAGEDVVQDVLIDRVLPVKG